MAQNVDSDALEPSQKVATAVMTQKELVHKSFPSFLWQKRALDQLLEQIALMSNVTGKKSSATVIVLINAYISIFHSLSEPFVKFWHHPLIIATALTFSRT